MKLINKPTLLSSDLTWVYNCPSSILLSFSTSLTLRWPDFLANNLSSVSLSLLPLSLAIILSVFLYYLPFKGNSL